MDERNKAWIFFLIFFWALRSRCEPRFSMQSLWWQMQRKDLEIEEERNYAWMSCVYRASMKERPPRTRRTSSLEGRARTDGKTGWLLRIQENPRAGCHGYRRIPALLRCHGDHIFGLRAANLTLTAPTSPTSIHLAISLSPLLRRANSACWRKESERREHPRQRECNKNERNAKDREERRWGRRKKRARKEAGLSRLTRFSAICPWYSNFFYVFFFSSKRTTVYGHLLRFFIGQLCFYRFFATCRRLIWEEEVYSQIPRGQKD